MRLSDGTYVGDASGRIWKVCELKWWQLWRWWGWWRSGRNYIDFFVAEVQTRQRVVRANGRICPNVAPNETPVHSCD